MLKHSNYKTLTFAFDVELDNDEYIPEGTKVKVYDGLHRQDSTKIIYNGMLEEYMNGSFIEYK